MELYPRIGENADIKVFTNCKFRMMSLAVLALIYYIKQKFGKSLKPKRKDKGFMLMGSKLHGVPVSATEAAPPTSPKVLSVSSTSATLSGIRAPLTIDDSDFEYDSFSSNESDSGIASDGFLSSEDGSETAAPDGDSKIL
ncbi:OLC1v1000979C1 [Oldenlandia corymbosa var. corymbosa]|uniref:OLC1v1000979C1 n=1 Tax=Oldenlandia corymbosa var. corymbosa TaxID=529605 RepID=A0AAV1D799_OLDCO|nr:OLC1v1000979C1 [Oldenlandia corymbosa var. corymbosa]